MLVDAIGGQAALKDAYGRWFGGWAFVERFGSTRRAERAQRGAPHTGLLSRLAALLSWPGHLARGEA